MMDHPLFVPAEPRPTRDQLIAKLVEANDGWDEMLQPDYVDPREKQKPFPFIFSPEEKWIRWCAPNGQHEHIENDIHSTGGRIPWSAFYGRYYPGEDDPVTVYGEQFHKLPWDQQRRYRDLIHLNWPGQEWHKEAGRLDLPDKYRDEDDWYPYTPQTYYHISNPKHRPSILEHGIDWQRSHPDDRLQNNDLFPDEEWPRGNYLFRDFADADLGPDDIYEVNAEGLNLLPDPYHDPETGIVYSPDVIPPDRLKLLQPGTWA